METTTAATIDPASRRETWSAFSLPYNTQLGASRTMTSDLLSFPDRGPLRGLLPQCLLSFLLPLISGFSSFLPRRFLSDWAPFGHNSSSRRISPNPRDTLPCTLNLPLGRGPSSLGKASRRIPSFPNLFPTLPYRVA
ncbi:hypothetical protein MTO96_049434 [Rhipicephalus appendiculatus]